MAEWNKNGMGMGFDHTEEIVKLLTVNSFVI